MDYRLTSLLPVQYSYCFTDWFLQARGSRWDLKGRTMNMTYGLWSLVLSLIWNMTLITISSLSTSLSFPFLSLSLSSAEKATRPHAFIKRSPGMEGARAVCRVPLLLSPSTLWILSKITQRKSRALLMSPLRWKIKNLKRPVVGGGTIRYLYKGQG